MSIGASIHLENHQFANYYLAYANTLLIRTHHLPPPTPPFSMLGRNQKASDAEGSCSLHAFQIGCKYLHFHKRQFKFIIRIACGLWHQAVFWVGRGAGSVDRSQCVRAFHYFPLGNGECIRSFNYRYPLHYTTLSFGGGLTEQYLSLYLYRHWVLIIRPPILVVYNCTSLSCHMLARLPPPTDIPKL